MASRNNSESAQQRRSGNRLVSSNRLVLGHKKVGRYEVLFPLAAGGMGGVHVGRLLGMAGFERLVAIKTIHPHLAQDNTYIEMFLDEARLAAGIHHPNVAEVLEVGEDDGLYFMVGEFVRGQDLRHLVERAQEVGQPLSQAMCAKICSIVCQGLHAAHELTDANGEPLHLVHRDISLRNILISYDGFVKLIDFGVAFARERLVHTETGALKGKMGFMSPEQIRGENIDRRSDVFSMGVVLCLMLTGQHPYPGGTDADRLRNVVEGKHVSPGSFRDDLDPDLEKIILCAIAQDPKNRYQTADEMRLTLEAVAKKSREEVDSTALGKIMRELFDDMYNLLNDQLKQTRQGSASGRHSSAHSSSESASEEDASYQSEIVESAIVVPKKSSVFWGALAGGLGAVIVAIIFMNLNPQGQAVEGRLAPISGKQIVPDTKSSLDVKSAVQENPSRYLKQGSKEQSAVKRTHSLFLRITPAHAQMVIDGAKLDPGAQVAEVDSQKKEHVYEVLAPGFQSQRGTIVVENNQDLEINLVKTTPPRRITSSATRKAQRTNKTKNTNNANHQPQALDIIGSPYK